MRLLGQGAGRDTHRPSPAGWFSLPRNRATGRPDIRTTGRVMMEFRLSTRDLLHRSEKVALHRMMHGSIQLPVMPRGVGRVALIARSVGRVRVTRPIVARHIRQSITAVAMHVVARMTSAVATAVPVATAVTTAVATAITGVPIATAVTTTATTVAGAVNRRVAA